MSQTPLQAIVRGGYIANRSPRGGRSYAQVKGLLTYLTYGSHWANLGRDPQARGVWLDHLAQSHTYEAVRHWARSRVHRLHYGHAYQLLLSTRHGGLTPADFNRALQEGSRVSSVREWRFMVHEDTANQHAHVLLFRRERLTRDEYHQWQQTMQSELGQLQTQRQQENVLEMEQTAGVQREPTGAPPPHPTLDLGAAL